MVALPKHTSWRRFINLLACCSTILSGIAGTASALPLNMPPQFRANLESGRLAPGVATALEREPASEVIVVLDDREVEAQLATLRGNRRQPDDDLIIGRRVKLLKEKKGALAAALAGTGHELLHDYDNFALLHLRTDSTAVARLLDNPAVLSIEDNRRFHTTLAQSLPLIHAPQTHAFGVTGSGTSVAVLDTGTNYTLADFGSCTAPNTPASCTVVYAVDIAANDGSLDDFGHGTNVAAIVLGVAPETRIVSLDVFRTDGYAWTSDLLTALNWVLTNRAAYNIAAVNMSLGGGEFTAQCPSDSLAGPIASLKSAGIATAIASGNDAYNGALSSPACVPAAVSVGAVYDANLGQRSWGNPLICTDATTSADKVTCFTNMTDFISLLAPGALITAAGYTYGGTSQASPHVAGAFALFKGAHPGFTVDDMVSRLAQTGTTVSTRRQSTTFDRPRINLEAALSYPRISVGPASHDFGTFDPVSPPRSRTFTVSNNGSDNLVIGTLARGGGSADFALANDLCSGQTLPATTSCTIDVVCTPLWTGEPAATLAIPSNDPDTPSVTVPLTAHLSRQTLSVAVNGNGTVTSQPAGIACGSNCSADFITGTPVTLAAQAAAGYAFASWNGACSGTGACQLTLNVPAAVSAAFSAILQMARTGGTSYATVADAYAAAADGAAIRLAAAALTEALTFDRDISIDLSGGYESTFTTVTGQTIISGSLTLASGTVSLSDIVLQ